MSDLRDRVDKSIAEDIHRLTRTTERLREERDKWQEIARQLAGAIELTLERTREYADNAVYLPDECPDCGIDINKNEGCPRCEMEEALDAWGKESIDENF